MTEKPLNLAENRRFDVAIIGGGAVGLSQAVALADGGLEVLVIDASDPATARTAAFDGRAFAVAHASEIMLKTLGVWPHLGPVQPINDILVFDGKPGDRFRRGGPSPFFLHFDRRDLDAAGDIAPLGSMVEASAARRALYERLAEFGNATLLAPATVERVDFHDEHVEIRLAGGETFRAGLAIAADGRNSSLRRQAGIRTVGWNYPQSGIVATIRHDRPHGGVAQEYFLPSGPFAILPLTDDRSSLVWTEKSDLVPAIMKLDDDAFTAQVRARCGAYLGHIEIEGPRFAWPLGLLVAREMIAPRLALIGDAAHAIHPISGQGWNLGLKDVAALAEVLIDARRLGLDIGAADILGRYQQWRRFDVVTLAAITDGLNRLFSTDNGLIRAARDLGMQAVNQITPLKKFFMRHAAGAVGDLPRLMTGERL